MFFDYCIEIPFHKFAFWNVLTIVQGLFLISCCELKKSAQNSML
jgi:hypothetical protein